MSSSKFMMRTAVATLENNIIRLAADASSMKSSLDAMAVQLSALRKVVTDMHLVPEPDADGWIARPTLR